ncbi:hypothetical protein [Leptolyngbya iicbica]|uniref:Uncharacterized protein n=2 Tax=Cyanophyceae TaxID=3028117 RepID=A0A4Q7E6B4_9CYAN|nr:hypothetical protein [Leptolyngbya sp. LK]RZM77791.1 hypothetical protein DYY88_14545 [Leptolyngbya sp. LK]
MGNSNPSLKNLEKGRGKKPKKPGSKPYNLRLDNEVKAEIERIAAQYGCLWGSKPWIGGLLEKIGRGELIVVPAPPKQD